MTTQNTHMRVLIAEDESIARRLLVNVLHKLGYAVVETANGSEAWQALQRPDAPRLAILDWMMPDIDGIEICRRLAALNNDQPPYIILLTARNETADIVAGLEAGADDYITKPFEPSELHARINAGQRMLAMRATLAAKVRELQAALDDVRTLRGLLPKCAHCKKVRDDEGSRKQMEVYARDNGEVVYSSGVCPDCMKILYPDFVRKG